MYIYICACANTNVTRDSTNYNANDTRYVVRNMRFVTSYKTIIIICIWRVFSSAGIFEILAKIVYCCDCRSIGSSIIYVIYVMISISIYIYI